MKSINSKSALFLLAGVAAGVTLGILFAPAKGKENREKLSDSFHSLGDKLADTATDTISSLLNHTQSVVSKLKSAPNGRPQYHHDDIEHAII